MTTNTHQSLQTYSRLPVGVASTRSVFQETMDKVLAELQRLSNILDDLLIAAKDDLEHLQNLEDTMQRLDEYGIN